MNSKMNNNSTSRRQIAYISVLGISQLHLRNPFVITWWSLAYPGMGHLLLSRYWTGLILFTGEAVINLKAHLNLAILYSFTGRFELAKQVLDKNWLLLYCALYIYTAWDSYRTAIDLNNIYILAAREDAEFQPFKIDTLELNYLDKRKPWVAAAWSLLFPGAGQLYIHRLPNAIWMILWWVIFLHFSKALPAIHYTFLGDFKQAKAVVDPQWLLNFSSLYLFAMYDAYVNAVEFNKLFEWEQKKYFKRHYQNANFNIPSMKIVNRSDKVHIISTFEHSVYLEKAITEIEMNGVAKEDILAVPLDKKSEERKLFDSIQQSDGLSLLDLPAILGTILMTLGTIYGFVLKWGPILWGLIGLFAGFALGLIIKLITTRKYTERQGYKKAAEVVLIIECPKDKAEMIKNTLWAHFAFGVSVLSLGNNE